MIKLVVMHTGYVESGRLGCVLYTVRGKFEDPVETVKALANQLYDRWKQAYEGFTTCCGLTHSRFGVEKFCSLCGASLEEKRANFELTEHFVSEFSRFVRDLPGSTADDDEEELENFWPWDGLRQTLKQGPLLESEVLEIYVSESLFSAIVRDETREKFVKRFNESREFDWTFDQILAKEIECRTI